MAGSVQEHSIQGKLRASQGTREGVDRAAKFACFDLFDTVLFRKVLDPTDVFRLVYHRLAEALPERMAGICEDAFVSARLVAERHARVDRAETTLDAIWEELVWMVGNDRDIAMSIEMSCERDLLYPNAEIAAVIAKRREQSHRIVYVSDMYLPEHFLRSVLEEHGIMQPGDRLFASSEHEKTKHEGHLYLHLMEEMGGKSADYCMTGDHRHSDHRKPRSLGLRSRHYRGHRLNAFERRLNDALASPQLSRSILVGSVRNGRADDQGSQNRLVSDFLGPASLLWALWTIRRAEEDNLDRLYFMARDGYLPYLAASHLTQTGLTRVESHYVYGSRYSLYFAAIRDLENDLRWIFDQPGDLTLDKLLRYLRLDRAGFSPAMQAVCDGFAGDDPLSAEDFDRIVDVLSASEEGRSVLDSAAEMRRAARQYFESAGLIGSGSSAIVDIGWHLNVQSALQSLMPEQRLFGLYLYLSETRRSFVQAGRAETMIELNIAHRRAAAAPALWRHSTVAEHLFGMAPEGSCEGFELDKNGHARPVLQRMNPDEAAVRQHIADQVQAFVRAWAPLYMQAFPDARGCAAAFRVLSDEFFDLPPREALLTIRKSVRLSREALNDESSALVSGFQLDDVKHAINMLRRRRSAEDLGWLGAKFSLAPRPLHLGGKALRKLRPYLG